MHKPQEPSQLGQRQTRQRDAIFQVIEKTSGPLAVEEIHQRAKKSLPKLGIATVYRALKLMLESRQVQQVNMPSGETRYESAHLGHHDHFQCRLCHKVFDLDICPLQLKTGTRLQGGFLVEGHELTISGLCAKCADGNA
jgi:Fur family ferric uptake transcriptional regulator